MKKMKEMFRKDNFHFCIVFILLFLFLPTITEATAEKAFTQSVLAETSIDRGSVAKQENTNIQENLPNKESDSLTRVQSAMQSYLRILFVAGALLPIFLFHIVLIFRKRERILNLIFISLLSILFLGLKVNYVDILRGGFDFNLTIQNRFELFFGIWTPLLFFLYSSKLLGFHFQLKKFIIPFSLFMVAGCSLFFVTSENYRIAQVCLSLAVLELCGEGVYWSINLIRKKEVNLGFLSFCFGLFLLISITDLLNYSGRYELKLLMLSELFLFFLLQMRHLLHSFTLVDSRSRARNVEMRDIWQTRKEKKTQRGRGVYQEHKLIRRNWHLMIQRRILIAKIYQIKTSYHLLDKGLHFKEQQTSMILHDLKHPLNVIMNLSEKEDQTAVDLQTIRRMSDRMLLLTQNVISVQQMEGNEIKMSKGKIKLDAFITDILFQYQSMAEGKRVKIIRRINSNLNIFADKELLRRIFVNLISNAIQYSPLGGEIDISSRLFGKTVCLDVSNQGPCLSEEEIKHLFDKEDSIGTILKEGSNGIGLKFCKMAIETMGGKIGVLNRLPGGVTFWVSFPVEQNNRSMVDVESAVDEEKILFERTKVELFEEEKNTLKKVVGQLLTIPCYQITDIEKILRNYSFLPGSYGEFFKEKVVDMVYKGNATRYAEILNQTLADIEQKELEHGK